MHISVRLVGGSPTTSLSAIVCLHLAGQTICVLFGTTTALFNDVSA